MIMDFHQALAKLLPFVVNNSKKKNYKICLLRVKKNVIYKLS